MGDSSTQIASGLKDSSIGVADRVAKSGKVVMLRTVTESTFSSEAWRSH